MVRDSCNGAGRLQGRTALITGASRGLGYAIAKAFAREGADLILSASNESSFEKLKKELELHDVKVSCFAADLIVPQQLEALFAFAVANHPTLDVLVNNAGIHFSKPFTEHGMDEFDQLMQVNVYAAFRLTQLAVEHMQSLPRREGRGKIVNMASAAGLKESLNQSAYNISKHAVIGMTKCVALEMAKSGINVNSICPGIAETDIIRNAEVAMQSKGMSAEEFYAAITAPVPIGRLLRTEEVAHIAVYLASSESNGMTGESINISGGAIMR